MDSPRDVYRDGADALERAVKKMEIDSHKVKERGRVSRREMTL